MPSSALTSQSPIHAGEIAWLNINSALTPCPCGCFIKPNYGQADLPPFPLDAILILHWAPNSLLASAVLWNDQSNHPLSLNQKSKFARISSSKARPSCPWKHNSNQQPKLLSHHHLPPSPHQRQQVRRTHGCTHWVQGRPPRGTASVLRNLGKLPHLPCCTGEWWPWKLSSLPWRRHKVTGDVSPAPGSSSVPPAPPEGEMAPTAEPGSGNVFSFLNLVIHDGRSSWFKRGNRALWGLGTSAFKMNSNVPVNARK